MKSDNNYIIVISPMARWASIITVPLPLDRAPELTAEWHTSRSGIRDSDGDQGSGGLHLHPAFGGLCGHPRLCIGAE